VKKEQNNYRTESNLNVCCNHIKNSNDVFHRDRKHIEAQNISNSHSNYEQNKKYGDIKIFDNKLYYRAIAMKTAG
jgi:hypothetical protein